jgi:16S rRNA (uracil1498-N3)-methyltransferase
MPLSASGASVAIPPAQAHYLGSVLRLGEGAPVLLFNGKNGEWRARIETVGRKAGALVLEERTREQASGPDLTLLFAPLKKGPTELVIRMGTELGVRRFVPVLTERTQAERVKTDRLAAIAIEAAEQCERLDVPTIAAARPLAEALEAAGPVLFCDEAGAAAGGAWGGGALPSVRHALGGTANEGWSVLIGPEGGFAPDERAALRARTGTVAVGLGPRVLKAETAAVAALTLWQATLGDL